MLEGAAREIFGLGPPAGRFHNPAQVRCWSNRTWPTFGFCYWIWTHNGKVVSPGSPADYGKFIGEQTEKWANVIRAANIKVK
jgi:hypothetical protein